jgi:hypothetical protein
MHQKWEISTKMHQAGKGTVCIDAATPYLQPLLLHLRPAHCHTLSCQEGEGHAPTYAHHICFLQEGVNHFDFVLHLGTTNDNTKGPEQQQRVFWTQATATGQQVSHNSRMLS